MYIGPSAGSAQTSLRRGTGPLGVNGHWSRSTFSISIACLNILYIHFKFVLYYNKKICIYDFLQYSFSTIQ